MPVIDAYTPWQEPREALERHVGREAERQAIGRYLDALADKQRPLPMWLCGSRGIGKSHLIALCRSLATERRLRVRLLPDDLPTARTAAQLLGTALSADPWVAWKEPTVKMPDLFLIDGLDHHLSAMGPAEQGELRRLLRERAVGLVATGLGVPTALTDREAPLYGSFDVWRLASLSLEEAEALVWRVAGEPPSGVRHLSWRRALLHLADGNPRALIALAQAANTSADVAKTLGEVLRAHAPHYQMRFRSLSPEAQLAVNTMAAAPRGVRPKELDGPLSNPSVVLSRLVDEGVLHRKEQGRAAWYLLSETLFRCWLEYRQTDWEETRAATLTRLLGDVLTRRELAHVWWEDENQRHVPTNDGSAAHAAVATFEEEVTRDRAAAFRELLAALANARCDDAMHSLAPLVVVALRRAGPQPPMRLEAGEREELLRVPVLRARFAVQGALPREPPLLEPHEIERVSLRADEVDLPELLSAAHQLGLPHLFARAARHPSAQLMPCPLPERPAKSRAGLLSLLERTSATNRWSWAASASLLDESEWRMLLSAPTPQETSSVCSSVTLLALLALGARMPERLAELALREWRLTDEVRTAQRVLAQLNARREGPLQLELDYLWGAIDPSEELHRQGRHRQRASSLG